MKKPIIERDNLKIYRAKKKCPDCDWGRLGILEYKDGTILYDCHKCGYNKDLSKKDKEKEGLSV